MGLDFIRAQTGPGSELVLGMTQDGTPVATAASVRGGFASWNHILLNAGCDADRGPHASGAKLSRRFEDIGLRMMNRTQAGFDAAMDPRKRAYAAQFLGMALVMAYNLVMVNKDKVEAVALAVMEEKEIFGDDLVRLLDSQNFIKPEIDFVAIGRSMGVPSSRAVDGGELVTQLRRSFATPGPALIEVAIR